MAKIISIITVPNPPLRLKSKTVKLPEINSPAIQKLIADMIKTMLQKEGVGLAAPQVKENIRLIVVNHKDGVLAMINPKITRRSWEKEWGEEGCLSVPGTFGEVKRHKKISCCYFNERAERKKITAEGLLARVIQHETDHLDGILFIDKARQLKKIKNEQK